MNVASVVAWLGLLMLGAAAGAQTPPAPSAQTPAPAPAEPPAAQPRPFPPGATIAFVNIQRIANESADGKAATAKVAALNQKKVAELAEKNKALQANQQKLQQQGSVLSPEAQAQIQKEIERQQVEIQRFTQDAQTEVQDLQQDLQLEFQKRLLPIIEQVAQDKGLYLLFSQGDSGIVWAHGGLDVTDDVIKRFDAATAAKPATKPQAGNPPR